MDEGEASIQSVISGFQNSVNGGRGGEMQSEGLYRHVDTSSLGASYLHPLTLVWDQEDSYCTEIVDLPFQIAWDPKKYGRL